MQFVNLPMDDFPIDHPKMDDVLDLLGCAEVFQIQREPQAPAGACYWVANDIARSVAGSVALGWMVEWVPGVYVNAMHHGVLAIDGCYIDVSGPQTARASQFTTFVPDMRKPVDLRRPVEYETQWLHLVDDENVIQAHEAYRENNRMMRLGNQLWADLGRATWSPITGWSHPQGRTPDFGGVDAKLRVSYERLHCARAEIRNQYFPGWSG